MPQKQSIENEQELIKQAQQAPAKFEPLYGLYYLPIFKFLAKRTKSQDIAGEITSIVFVKAMENIGKYQYTGAPFSSWLFRIAHNALNDMYRKNKVSRVVDVDTQQLVALVEDDVVSDKQERIELMIQTISELEPDEITLLELRFFEERRFKEIGEILDVTEENARIRTHRLIAKMKKMLNVKNVQL
ncbi:MAG: sigma-70 family RNA polymerase sigma factor [Flavobacteriales bacterium]|nr:sigma-70 family RNA polymerase sigma factor [Flavobacteriales bacterium]